MAYQRSVQDILTDLLHQLAGLVRTEAQLARAETSEKLSQIGAGTGLLATGVIILIPGLVLLLQAAAMALVQAGIDDFWAALIVGGIAAVVGLILARIGVSRFNASRLMPSKTIEQVQRDVGLLTSSETEPHLMGETSDHTKQVGVQQYENAKEAAAGTLSKEEPAYQSDSKRERPPRRDSERESEQAAN